MSKTVKVLLAREHAKRVMDRCTIGNPHAFHGGSEALSESQKIGMTSAIPNAVAGFGKGLKMAKVVVKNVTTLGKLDNEGWLRIGDNFVIQMKERKIVSLVCDTCAATMAAKLSRDVNFLGTKVEMVRCGFNVHPFLAVDREGGDINSFLAWGSDAFVVDIWDDKLDPSSDDDKLNGVFETPATSSLAIDYAMKKQLKVTQTFVLCATPVRRVCRARPLALRRRPEPLRARRNLTATLSLVSGAQRVRRGLCHGRSRSIPCSSPAALRAAAGRCTRAFAHLAPGIAGEYRQLNSRCGGTAVRVAKQGTA